MALPRVTPLLCAAPHRSSAACPRAGLPRFIRGYVLIMPGIEHYDAIIVGAGQAGVPLARDLAGAGWKTALVERTHVGGSCVNEGCTPTKTMAASARVAYLARRAADYGVQTGPVVVDMSTVRQRKRDIVELWRTGAERRLRDTAGLDLLFGEARFVGEDDSGAGRRLSGERVADEREAGTDLTDTDLTGIDPTDADLAGAHHTDRRYPHRQHDDGHREHADDHRTDRRDSDGCHPDGHRLAVRTAAGDEQVLEAPRILLDTGARPSIPNIVGLENVAYLDSTTIMELDEVPEHLLVLGAGYVAVEFAQMFRRFGSRVTIIHRGERVLSREDPDVAEALADILQEDGVDIVLQSHVGRVERRFDAGGLGRRDPGGAVIVRLQSPAGPAVIEGSHLLVATGRRPNTEALELAVPGVDTDDHGYVLVNERLETSAQGIWALGDIKGGPAFTHISYDDYRIVKTNLLGPGGASTADRVVPYTIFTDPQLGRVGLSETEARAKGLDVEVATLPMSRVARALQTAESRGFIKAVVERSTGRILGAAVLGVDGGELMGVIEVAMLGGLRAQDLHNVTFAHPTLAEALNNLFIGV